MPEYTLADLNAADSLHWITQRQLASAVERSLATLKNWRRTSAGPAYSRQGHLVFYQVCDVRAWLKRNSRLSTSETPKQAEQRLSTEGASA